MGLLDSVLGAALNSQNNGQGGLLGSLGGLLGGGSQEQSAGLLSGLLDQVGGLNGLQELMGKAGLGEQVSSWIGNGQNLPVSAEQIQSALGSGVVGSLAGKLGLDASQASGMLAQVLPDLVNHLTPQGQVTEGAAASGQLDASSLVGMLGGLLGGHR